MTRCIFAAAHFNDEQAAYDYVEARIWANGRVCPHCGIFDRSGRLAGKSDRPGLYKCYACRKKFTVKIGTIFEDSHIQMRDWLTSIHLLCSSKKGVSSKQLHRTLGITLKSAWFLSHRIREAMRSGDLSPMGGEGAIVEIDETFIGRKEGAEVRRGGAHKNIVLSLVERGGEAPSFHVASTKKEDIIPIVKANIAKETHVIYIPYDDRCDICYAAGLTPDYLRYYKAKEVLQIQLWQESLATADVVDLVQNMILRASPSSLELNLGHAATSETLGDIAAEEFLFPLEERMKYGVATRHSNGFRRTRGKIRRSPFRYTEVF